MYKKLSRDFYLRDTNIVAKELIGKLLVKKERNGYLSGKIVECEAYIDTDDPASHSFGKITKRNKVMFEKGGTVYVYFIYGNHYCLNIVTDRKGKGCAVLIRAIEPIEGIEIMKKRRKNITNIYNISNGPAKVCQAFGIDLKMNGKDITGNSLFIAESNDKDFIKVRISRRIGIKKGSELPYRYFIYGNSYVTKSVFNEDNLKI